MRALQQHILLFNAWCLLTGKQTKSCVVIWFYHRSVCITSHCEDSLISHVSVLRGHVTHITSLRAEMDAAFSLSLILHH